MKFEKSECDNRVSQSTLNELVNFSNFNNQKGGSLFAKWAGQDIEQLEDNVHDDCSKEWLKGANKTGNMVEYIMNLFNPQKISSGKSSLFKTVLSFFTNSSPTTTQGKFFQEFKKAMPGQISKKMAGASEEDQQKFKMASSLFKTATKAGSIEGAIKGELSSSLMKGLSGLK